METNYEVKPKKSLRPLKAGLLVLAMVCFVLGTFAQQGQAVKVANNQQLLQALENPSTQTLVFGSGFEGVSAMNSPQALNAIRSAGDGGRSITCFYYIAESDVCWYEDTLVEGVSYRHNFAIAGSIDPYGCNCCPINLGDDLGVWSWKNTPGSGYDNPPPPGGNLIFLDPIIKDSMDFIVSKPGIYTLRYSWGTPWFSYVQTEYRFLDPFDLSISAPDTCGLCTEVHMEISSYFRTGKDTIEYYLYNPCTNDTVPVTGPALDNLTYLNGYLPPVSLGQLEPDGIGDDDTLQVEDFEICAPDFGYWQFCANIHPKWAFRDQDTSLCGPVLDCIWIDFSKEPIANAGPDAEICDSLCYQLVGSTGIWNECYISPTYIHKWTKVSGPGLISITNPYSLTTDICRDDQTCSYGQYVIALEVTNGECYDSDTTVITFYEQPTANAGDDQYICADLCFSLYALDFTYCSAPIADERYNYWEFLSGPGVVDFDPELSQPNVCVTGECPYGIYTFVYHEINGTCSDTDTTTVALFEQPYPDAGPDQTLCNDFAFSIYGILDTACSRTTVIGIEWTLFDQPDGCTVSIDSPNDLETAVLISECGPCPYGDYTFRLTQTAGYIDVTGSYVVVCTGYDDVTVCISEQPTADAGEDFSMCYYGGCFTLAAMPFSYCNDEICGPRYGKWSKIGGPAAVEFTDENAPDSQACPDETSSCVYGVYTFVWEEFNGECSDADTVAVTLYEPPTANGGDDAEYCVDREFSMELWHTFAALPFTYCQEDGFEAPYGYWSKSCGPGYVTFFEENNPNGWVHVTAFGCYCFVWHEVNGDCEDTDTLSVCFYEHPHLEGELHDSACIAELPACYDLGLLGLVPYEYLPDPNVNYNVMGWSQIGGSGNATFTDPSDPNTEVCVDNYGCYTFAFIQYNGMEDCSDTAYAYLTYFEQPTANAGEDQSICGSCLNMSALPYSYVVNDCAPADNQIGYWNWFTYEPPADPCPSDNFAIDYSVCGWVANSPPKQFMGTDPGAEFCVCDNYCGSHYGTYGFEWVEVNGTCEDRDTVYFEMKKVPDPLPLRGCFNPANSCNDYGPGCYPYGELYPGYNPYECGSCQFNCLFPDDTIFTVCAESCMNFSIDWPCICQQPVDAPGEDGYSCPCGPIPGWTYEWSFIGPAGSYFNADPLWWDCDAQCWKGSDQVNVCFGECCDTARLYLTITTPQGCVTTEEWKIVVQHRPDATISGPAVAEIGTPTIYTIPDPQNPCYLYIWEVQQCGVIASGQGTGQITVDWTNYTANNGWGLVYVEIHDTCTGCCNVDSLWVKVYPAGTLGDATLSGHVYYHNNIQTPLNGVELTLWNSGVAVATTTSFNDIEGGNGVGYYEFNGINGITNFGITANYTAPWYGANATDALAVELKVINNLPGSFLYDNVVAEAMDVNNSNSITATDALWIKQRAINMISYFPAGNWVYAPAMASTAGTYDVYTLNAGDANRSNIPASMKETPAINLITDGTMNVKTGQEYTLPIRIDKANLFGAMTLNLGYNPALLDVVEVNSIDGMLTNIADGNISIAWSSVNPMVLAENDVVVTLKVKALGVTSASDQLFTVGLGSEFADPSANVIEPVTLKTYGISTEPAATDYFMSANRPNPFNTYTFIEYTLPETGKVKLSVLDMLGQELAVLVEATQTAGSYSVKFENPGLATGVYIYKITVDGETRDYISSQRMVISH